MKAMACTTAGGVGTRVYLGCITNHYLLVVTARLRRHPSLLDIGPESRSAVNVSIELETENMAPMERAEWLREVNTKKTFPSVSPSQRTRFASRGGPPLLTRSLYLSYGPRAGMHAIFISSGVSSGRPLPSVLGAADRAPRVVVVGAN